MNYTLHQLRVFLKVAEYQSITQASADLNLTQPAVSIQLRNFQNQFDIPLTETVGRRLFITPFGLEIAEAARNILDEVYAVQYKTSAYKNLLSGKLRLAVASTGKYVMPYFLSDFLKKYPEVELEMLVANKVEVIQSLSSNEVDFALVTLLPDQIPVQSESLLDCDLHFIAPPGFSLHKPADLEATPVLFREKGSATRIAMEQYFVRHNLVIRKKIEMTSNEAIKQAVLAGMGTSLMPALGIQTELDRGLLQIASLPDMPLKTNWKLVWIQGKRFLPAAKAYLNFVKAEKGRIARQYF